MSSRVVLIASIVIALAVAARLMMPALWWAIGRLRVRQAGPRPLHASMESRSENPTINGSRRPTRC